MQIRKGTEKDIEEVAALYDAVNDYLESHTNYPGWRKGVYPIREDAAQGIAENNLFVAEAEGQIAGTFILRHRPEEAYALADWGNQLAHSNFVKRKRRRLLSETTYGLAVEQLLCREFPSEITLLLEQEALSRKMYRITL